MITWGIVVAGGSGQRFGRLKQVELLAGRRVVDWATGSLLEACEGVVLVVPEPLAQGFDRGAADLVVAGGKTRSASVRAGMAALGDSVTHVLVHDAARPLATNEVCSQVVLALAGGASAAVPVVPVTDSLRTVDSQCVDRSHYVAVQTPQGFDLEALRRAHQSGLDATDDASLFDELGIGVIHVAGDPINMKITNPFDLAMAEAVLTGHREYS